MRLGKYSKYLCLSFSGKEARSQLCLSRQLACSLGKQPGSQWETPLAPVEITRNILLGLNLHMPLGNGKWVAWCRQGHSLLDPPPGDGEPSCARLQAHWLLGTAPAPSPISHLGQVVFLVPEVSKFGQSQQRGPKAGLRETAVVGKAWD